MGNPTGVKGLMGNRSLEGGQPKKKTWTTKETNWSPKGQISKKVTVELWVERIMVGDSTMYVLHVHVATPNYS